MNIETIDLGAEASRYRDAFDLDRSATYEFLGFEGQSMMLSLHQNGETNPKLSGRPEITFECIISEKSRIFGLSSAEKFDNQPRTPEIWTLISLDWNGRNRVTTVPIRSWAQRDTRERPVFFEFADSRD